MRCSLGEILGTIRRTALAVTATLIVMTSASSVTANARRLVHAPIFVGRPPVASGITPYVFNYSGHYSYNSPGPVFYHLAYQGTHNGCWLWRYNYLNWIC